MRSSIPVVVPVLALAMGCATSQPPVAVVGAEADVAALIGEWTGRYGGTDTGRQGDIYLRFDPGSAAAVGYVLMVPEGSTGHDHPEGVHPAHEFIDIAVLRVAGNEVRGTLAIYQDPRCGCRIETTFRGSLRDGTIRGTFRSVHLEGGGADEGEWWATRGPPSDGRGPEPP